MSRDETRARAKALREQEAAAERRRERTLRIGIAVGVVAVVVAIGLFVQAQRSSVDPDAARPSGVSDVGGGLPFGPAAAPVTVDLWEDFQCPACKQFEAQNAELLEAQVAAGDIRLVIHPLSFLDRNLSNSSSLLAANAFGCVADAADDAAALEFHRLVFEAQPAETPGQEAWDADALVGFAAEAGVTGDEVESCIRGGTFTEWARAVDMGSASAGVTGTPTLFIDGEKVPDDQLSAMFDDSSVLAQALAAAAR